MRAARAIVFEGVGKENAGAHQTITAVTVSIIANVPLRPIRVKRHLPREKE
jgi:hypothetical protein